jgi:hypothetical protein
MCASLDISLEVHEMLDDVEEVEIIENAEATGSLGSCVGGPRSSVKVSGDGGGELEECLDHVDVDSSDQDIVVGIVVVAFLVLRVLCRDLVIL